MIDKIFARQMENGLWQWRLRDGVGWHNQGYYTGDTEALLNSLEGQQDLSVCLILRGATCVASLEHAETKNRRVLGKLLPYELEDDIIDPIDELHFAFGEVVNENVSLVYTRADNVGNAITKLEEIQLDVAECVPDYLLLQRDKNELVVVWDEDEVLAHYGDNQGFAIQQDIAQLYLKQLPLDSDEIKSVTLVANSSEQCDELMRWLPSALYEGPEIKSFEGGFWDCVSTDDYQGDINLRCGQFAVQLPLARWWQTWKKPVYFLGAAALMSVVVNFGMYFQAKQEYNELLEARKQIFLKAIPNGRWQTPERELRARLGDNKTNVASTNFMYLLNSVAKTFNEKEGISLGSLRYSGDQQELIVSFEVGNFADVENIRGEIEKLGYKAETLRAAARNENFQARIKISQAAGSAS